MRLLKFSAIWRNPDFVWLWMATSIAAFGGQITEMILPYTAATVLHASASQMGLLVALQTLPFALFSLPSGVWLERIHKLPLLRICFAGLILALASVPLVAYFGTLSLHHIYVLGFLIGAFSVFAGTALQVLTTHTVGKDLLVQAHGAMSAVNSASRMAGPALAGAILQVLAAPVMLLIECVTLFAALLMLQKMKIVEPAPQKSSVSFLDQVREGVRFVFQDPHLRTLTWAVAAWQLLYHGVLTLQILLATRDLGLSGGQIGLGFAAGGVTAIIGSIAVPRLTARHGVGKVMVVGFVLTACGWLLLAGSPQGATVKSKFALFALAQVVFQLGVALFFVTYIAMRQALTPAQLLSRVTATMRFLTVAVAPIGATLAGFLGTWLGVETAITLIALTSVLLVIVVARLSSLHRLEEIQT
jgi:MFS family permease